MGVSFGLATTRLFSFGDHSCKCNTQFHGFLSNFENMLLILGPASDPGVLREVELFIKKCRGAKHCLHPS